MGIEPGTSHILCREYYIKFNNKFQILLKKTQINDITYLFLDNTTQFNFQKN